MGSGGLDQRITFRRYAETSDGAGGSTVVWSDFATVPAVWAKVTPRTRREVTADNRVIATGVWTFLIRNRSDVSEADRIVWQSETYNIRGIARAGTRELYLEIEAERGTGDVEAAGA